MEKRVEKIPAAGEEKIYLKIFEALADPAVIFQKYVIINCNQLALEQLKCSREQIIGKKLWDISPHRQPDGNLSETAGKRIIDAVREAKKQYFGWQHKASDGTLIDVEISLDVIDADQSLFLVIWRDLTEHKKAEKALWESNSRLRLALQETRTGIWEYFPRTGNAFFNPEWYRLFGYKVDEFPATLENWEDRLHPEDRSQVVKTLKRFVTGRKSDLGPPFRFRSQSGQWQWVQSRGIILERDEENRIVRILGVHTDISEYKSAEHKYRTLFEGSLDGIVFIDGEGRFLDFNESYRRMVGYTRAELFRLGGSFEITPIKWHTWEREEIMQNQLERRGFADTFQKEYIRKDGTIFPVELTAYRLEPENITAPVYWAVVRDISERLAREKIVEENEKQWRLIIDNIPSVVWKSSRDGNTKYISKNIRQVYGYSQEEIYSGGQALWLERIHPEDHRKVVERFTGLFEGKGKYDVEYRIRHKDGHWIWLHDQANMIVRESAVFYAYGIFSDISVMKKLEDEKRIRELMLQRSQRLASLGGLASAIAHEIRQPLNLIKIISDTYIYARRQNFQEELSRIDLPKKMEQISAGVQRINTIIKNLQNLIKRPEDIEKAEYALDGLIHETLDFFLQKLRNHGIQLCLDLQSGIQPVMISPIQFQEVLSNLLNNAVEALDECKVNEKRICVSVRQNRKVIVLEVADNGPGISSEYKEKIFDPLFSTKFSKDSMGLGLYIVNTILDALGGSAEVLDNKGGGAVFRISIPL